MRSSDFLRISEDPRTAILSISVTSKALVIGTLGPVPWETQDNASCSMLKMKYLLMMVSRCEVLGTRRCSVARVAIVQSVLCEETAIVLVHSTRPESRTLCEIYPGSVFCLDLGFDRRWWPLQIPSHVACSWSLGCCRLGLVHRCWCLEIQKIKKTQLIE